MSVTTPADAIADMSGYKLLEKIYASGHCLFYRAVRTADNTPVIIKQFISEYPTASVVSRFQNEFQLAGSLPLTGVLQPLALITLDKAPGIVYEDFNFISLKNYVKKNTPELSAALKIGIQLAEALEGIHLNNIVLKGINPYNILIDTGRLAVKIADFSSADRFEMEHAAIKKTKDAVQSLAYISPEQTGRMNCTMDYRTDFYSLGVTLYETFTGRLPFDYDDKLQLLYCHLAQIPPAPHLLNKNIPAAVSAIILKLLAKKADERYQTASGIKADLKKCLEKLNSAGKVEEFELGKEDISKRFRVSQKLYGRESQISEMLQAFSRVSRGAAEVFMVTGYSGIGKSSLVYEIHKPVLQNRGYFISGKFDQYKRDVPYFSLVQAFQDLVKQILTESDEAIALWKKKLTEALAPNGQLIIEVIPEVESIIGKQQPVPELPPAESQNRFNLVFLEFVKVFSSPTHPLAVFLDDLQWSDLASLRLIELITGDTTIHHLFLIGAYRNNEVSATHPLTITLEKIRKSPAVLHTIILEPLSLTDINHLLADSLSASAEKTKSLALLSGQKTNGNPFFLNQFLKTLYQEQLLYFDGNAKQWAWEIEKIKQQNITENVVELMAGKIQKLGNPVQQTLMLAACIGSRFDLKTLAVVCEKTPAEVSCELLPALAEGLLVPLNADYNYAGDLPGSVFYEFLHDRVQQAAYSLIDERYRKTVHLKIGRLLLDNTPEEAMDDEVFNIISHLNTAMDLIESPAEKALLARLNLSAGKKAMASVAFQSALRYFETGIRLLGNSSWEHHYDLTLSLYNEATEASYLVTDFFSMRRLADEALRNAQSLLDKLKVYEVMISASISQDKMLEAVQQALEVLRLLGAKFPPNPGKGDILFSLLRTQWLLAGKKPEDLENLPLMSDPAYRAVMRIMARINSASYLAMPSLLPLLVLKATRMSVKYGNTEESAYAFALYGMILCGVLGDIDKGYRFGNLAMRLVQKLNIRFYKTRVHLGVSDFVTHWKEPLRNTFEPMLEGYRSGLETGDFEFAGFIAHNYCSHLYFAGVNLKEVNSEINKYSSVMRSLEHKAALLFNDLFQQAVLNFMGKNEDPRFLMGEVYDERKMLQVHRELRQGTAIYYMYVNKLMLCYHFEDYQRAIENAENAEKNLESAIALYAVPLLYLYDALARLARYHEFPSGVKIQTLRKANAALRKLKKWAKHAPANYQNKYCLLAAEHARVRNKKAHAIRYYDEAIRLAKENEFLQEEALANELAAKFHLAEGSEKIARYYLKEAHFCYQKWGAAAKVERMERHFPYLAVSEAKTQADDYVVETADMETIFRASKIFLEVIVLDELLKKIMEFVIRNAGAQKGVLLLQKQNKWRIEAEADGTIINVLQSLPLENSESVSDGIIHYVIRTRENVVLGDASSEGNFMNDAYVSRQRPKSVLCIPLINQGRLEGILYLENNLTTHAFTPQRISVLNMLSSQMAVSIENARLYKANELFVPRKVLSFLNKESIIDIELGNQVEKEMTVMFSDIRDFTSLSEKMTPEETFRFINDYLAVMEPLIIENNGFIDKYVGDGIMALFPNNADEALRSAISMVKTVDTFNNNRLKNKLKPVSIGIGLNTGTLMLGIIGGKNQVDTTVLSDTVNLSSRLEALTKTYGISLIISEHTCSSLADPQRYAIREIDSVTVRGMSRPVRLFEVFDGEVQEVMELKNQTLDYFQKGLGYFQYENFEEALKIFTGITEVNPNDEVAKIYVDRCKQKISLIKKVNRFN